MDQAEAVSPERDIKLLLKKHRSLIDELKTSLADHLDPEKHDDIFLLRYVLSYKTKESASKRILAGIEYRKNNPYLELEKNGKMHPEAEHIREYTCASYHGQTNDGGPIQVIRAGLTNIAGLFENCRVDDVIEEMTLSKENAYTICDEVTRKTGRLTKQIVIFDMRNVGWIYPSQDLISSQNRASEIAKNLYPQLLDRVIIINCPWFFSQLFKIAKMVLSESLTSKAAVCGGTIVPNGLSDCPWASQHIDPAVLPDFVGGSCNKCEPGCVGETKNDQTKMKAGGKMAPPPKEGEELPPPPQGGGWLPSSLSGWW